MRRIIFVICVMLMAGAVCGAQQTTPIVVPAQQASAALEPVRSAEMDALAQELVAKIPEGKATSVVVVGGAAPENRISELGASLRDGLDESLARQATGFRVISTADVSDILRRNRVSAGMIYCNLVSEWIAAHVQADAAVVLRFERLENGKALVTAEVWDERTKTPAGKHVKVAAVPYAKIRGEISLTEAQISARMIQYRATLSVPATTASKEDADSAPKCVDCPGAGRFEKLPQISFHGTIYASVTVLPDGTSTDIMIDRPAGLGLDPIAIRTLLMWKFKPGVDGEKRPVATRINVELAFQLN